MTTDADTPTDHDEYPDAIAEPRWWTWPAIIAGALICTWAVVGAIVDDELTSPVRWGAWLVVPAVIHDTIWAAGVAIAAVASVWMPGWMKVPFRVGLGMTAVVLLIAWPLLGRYGERPDNPTVLPFDYWPRVGVLLLVIWAAMVIWMLVRVETSRR